MPRRGGRPPLDPNSLSGAVTFRIPQPQLDRLHRLAFEHRCSVAALARFAVRRLLKAADLSHPVDKP